VRIPVLDFDRWNCCKCYLYYTMKVHKLDHIVVKGDNDNIVSDLTNRQVVNLILRRSPTSLGFVKGMVGLRVTVSRYVHL
jgi:hypothetical protein